MSKPKVQSTQTVWSGNWQPDQQFTGGEGAWCEGKIVDLRFHSVQAKNDVARFNFF